MFSRRLLRVVPRRPLPPLTSSYPSGPCSSSLILHRATIPTSSSTAPVVMVSSLHSQPIAAASQPPRVFPTSGFQVIDPSDKVEEEKLPFYQRDEYYPMRMGEVIGKHYQVVAKLGYGTTSTVWLGRDLRYHPVEFSELLSNGSTLTLVNCRHAGTGSTGRSKCTSTSWDIVRSA